MTKPFKIGMLYYVMIFFNALYYVSIITYYTILYYIMVQMQTCVIMLLTISMPAVPLKHPTAYAAQAYQRSAH